MIKRVGVALLLAAVAVAACGWWYVNGAWPVPRGHVFPRHAVWGGGPAALFEGRLRLDGTCIRTDAAVPATVVWPPGYRLALVDGQPVVYGGSRELRMGELVRMGGGWYEDGDPPPTSFAVEGCPPPFFLSTGFED
ncbi:MAG TPA: hypothetical protein VFY43_08585 [Candidatus Limnocylindria bacterium]|nr:hypothetical protein [Candidatus Limnocylindria bacterium]